MTGGIRPTQHNLCGSSPTTRSLVAQWDQLELRHGLLHRRWESEDGRRSNFQPVVPCTLMHDILHSLHNDPYAGHVGYRKTLRRVRQRFYGPGLIRDVREWCRRCQQCASHKSPSQAPRATLSPSRTGYPMERVALDIMGPLPTTERNNIHTGNQ
jgi:hypothetical protein